MRLILIISITILVFIKSAIGWKAILDRYDLKYLNTNNMKVTNAKIYKFNRTTKAATFYFEIFNDTPPSLMIEIRIFGFISNEYRPLPLVITRRVCDILNLEYQWIKHEIQGKLSDSCPIPKGQYYLIDYVPNVSLFPKRPWSINNYMIRARLFYEKDEEVLLDIYVITTDDDEYAV